MGFPAVKRLNEPQPALVDLTIQIALVAAFAVLFLAGLDALGGGGLGAALFAVLSFLLFTGYDVVFEVFASGRTPGKRLNGLRVVRGRGSRTLPWSLGRATVGYLGCLLLGLGLRVVLRA